MIASRVRGGVGNQLFEYAAGRALADRHGTDLLLHLEEYDREGARPFVLDRFNGRYSIAEPGAARALNRAWERSMSGKKSWLDVLHRRRGWRILEERGYRFEAAVMSAPDQTYLRGYWQSERYFAHCRDSLLAELQPRDPLAGLSLELANRMRAHPASVALHVRRGDYLVPSTLEFHGVMPVEYYRDALAALSARLGSLKVFVFSDEPAWVKENLSAILSAHDTIFIEHNQDDGVEDLRLMSLCRHQVIANSSYSWWGAWLNRHSEKIVVAPKNWFRSRDVDTAHVVPESWLKI